MKKLGKHSLSTKVNKMFIRSSTAINDCLISLDAIGAISLSGDCRIIVFDKLVSDGLKTYEYNNSHDRDKAFDEMCKFLNDNYRLRDFT